MRWSRVLKAEWREVARLGIEAVVVAGALAAGGEYAVAQGAGPASAAAPLVFRNVAVIDVRDGRRRPHQTVVVIGNRIRTIGAAQEVSVPVGARVVEARGKYLIPGLWDMHVHPTVSENNLSGGLKTDYIPSAYSLLIANGVTGVRDAGSWIPLATLNRWKQDIAAGARVGPRMIVSSQLIDGDGQPCTAASWPHHICVSTPAEARLLVDLFKTTGADMIKMYNLSRELYLAIAAEARRIGIPFGGHAVNIGGLEASDSGARILDHYTWFNPNVCGGGMWAPDSFSTERCAAAAQQLRRNDTWIALGPALHAVDPFSTRSLELNRRYQPVSERQSIESWNDTLRGLSASPTSTAAWTAVFAAAEAAYAKRIAQEAANNPDAARIAAQWAAEQRMFKLLPLLVGTDAGIAAFPTEPVLGFGVHDALVFFVVAYGMTPLQALQTATLNPALVLHATDSLGTVEVGKLADLVLLDADPLEDIWNTTKIRAVVANGRYYDRAALDRLLAEAERVAHAR